MKWLLEKDVFDEDLESLKKAIIQNGCSYEEIVYGPFESNVYLNYDEWHIFYGSIALANQLKRDTNCQVYYTPLIYDCSRYYHVLDKYLLNRDCVFTSFGSFRESPQRFFESYGTGKHNCIFVRPNSGDKLFTGCMVCEGVLTQDLKFINRYGLVPDNATILVSTVKPIEEEIRFVVCGTNILTGSIYKRDNEVYHEEVLPINDAWQFAEQAVLTLPNTDLFWTLDVCRSNNKLHVLEIGCFSCAGLYACDMDKIVKMVEWAQM
jgi:hypothetical protein